jgi:hypothetical protein
MERKNIYTLIGLFIITTLTAIFSNIDGLKIAAFAILFLSAIKFVLVAFQFMELKKANNLWKILLLGFLSLFVAVITIVLY